MTDVASISKPFRRASRESRENNSVITVAPHVSFGGSSIPIIAGPCAVESEEQITEIARMVRDAGATMLRGGAFKPRTSPYSFQGIGLEGLGMLARAREQTGLPVVTEVMDPEHVPAVEEHSDVLQIGSRNMQNFSLLKRVGLTKKPVLLKRGSAATILEWLLSAEYILDAGNDRVILCERGIRGFDAETRNVLDLASIPAARQLTHLPIIADPSHGTGRRDLVVPMGRAAVACGADGLIIEVHHHPDQALSDGSQSLWPEQFADLMRGIGPIAESLGRTIASPA